jgi:hypothetical protein
MVLVVACGGTPPPLPKGPPPEYEEEPTLVADAAVPATDP